jgi:glycosyltransferase involved in cell wall biosynthesis
MNPKISVIIPYYNYGQYIKETVASVLAQTFKDYEIIIIDDESTDTHSIQVLAEIEKKYPGIKIIRQKNGHLSNARNNGIKVSQGDFFLSLDSDDTIEPTMLEKCFEAILKDSKLGFVYTFTHFFDQEDIVWKNQEYNLYDLLWANHPTVCALVRKKAWEEVGGYDENMKAGYEDWEFWIRLGRNGWFGKLIREPLFNYRRHGESMISGSELKHDKIVKYIREKYQDLYSRESMKKIKKTWKPQGENHLELLKSKIKAAGLLDNNLWKKHPLSALGRFVPIRIKRKTNSLLGRKIFETGYYKRSRE